MEVVDKSEGDREDELKVDRENAKFLVTIVLTTLLAMTFWSAKFIEANINNKDYFMIFAFSLGIVTLSLLFLSYVTSSKIVLIFAYTSSFLLGMTLIDMFIGGPGGFTAMINYLATVDAFLTILLITVLFCMTLLIYHLRKK